MKEPTAVITVQKQLNFHFAKKREKKGDILVRVGKRKLTLAGRKSVSTR